MKRICFRRSFVCACAFLLAGCYSTTGTVSRDPVAYVQLSGVTGDLTAVVDDSSSVTLMPKKGEARLQVSPGRHRLRVMRGATTLVDRTILVSDLQTLEIHVP